jgi:hypothetical protein
VFGKIIKPSGGGDDDMGVFSRVLDLILVILQWHSSKVAPISQFWGFEISS